MISVSCLQIWNPPRGFQLQPPNCPNNLSSDYSLIPSLLSNQPLPINRLKLSTKRELKLWCGAIPEGSVPDPPSDHWKSWLVGILISLLPFLKNKLGSLLKLKNEVEAAIETVDEVMEAAEKVAGEVEKVAEVVAEETPVGSKLHHVAVSVDSFAKEAAKDAHLADHLLDKVEEVEKEMESLVELMVDEPTNN